jgi:prepilin-type N-terminal cleavage/methylation domain-containing protein
MRVGKSLRDEDCRRSAVWDGALGDDCGDGTSPPLPSADPPALFPAGGDCDCHSVTQGVRLHGYLRGRDVPAPEEDWREGFTLLELIIVMTLITVTISVAIPRLASFFRGRMLDSEARRVLALARHAQAQATSEGVPVHLWVDARNGRIGVEADPSYSQPLNTAPDTQVDEAIRLEVSYSEGRLSPERQKANHEQRHRASPAKLRICLR